MTEMDKRLKNLKKYPARGAIEEYSDNYHYPFTFAGVGGIIFHQVQYKYKDNLLNTLTMPYCADYR